MREDRPHGSEVHSLQVLDNESRGAAAAVADTSDTDLGLLLTQHGGEGSQDTSTRASQRVSDGDGTAKDIDLLIIQVQELDVGQSNDREGLVDLVVVNVLLCQAGMLESLGDGQCGGNGEALGLPRGISPAQNLSDRLKSELLQLGLGDQDDGSGAIVERRGIGGRDGTAIGNENRAHRLQLLSVEVLDLLVPIDRDSGFVPSAANLDGSDLGLEDTSLGRSLSTLVCLDGILILLLAGHAVVRRAELGLHAHELLLAVGIAEAVLLHAVHEGSITVLVTGTKVREVVGGVGHALGTTSDNDRSVAGDNGLRTKDDGLQARRAHLVDRCADDTVGKTGVYGALAGRSLADTEEKGGVSRLQQDGTGTRGFDLLGREHIAEEDLFDILGLNLRNTLDSSFSEEVSRGREGFRG